MLYCDNTYFDWITFIYHLFSKLFTHWHNPLTSIDKLVLQILHLIEWADVWCHGYHFQRTLARRGMSTEARKMQRMQSRTGTKKNQQRRWELLKVNNYGLRANSFCFPIDEKTKRELAPIYTLGYITRDIKTCFVFFNCIHIFFLFFTKSFII